MVDSNYILYNNIRARFLFLKSFCMRDQEEKLKLLKECIEVEPDAAYAFNEIGAIYIDMKLYDRAEAAFITAKELTPNWSYPYNNLASLIIK